MDGGGNMTDEGREHLLAQRIYDLVRHYTRIKAENKSGKKLVDFKKDEVGKIIYPHEYREAVEKTCMDAFLAMRGRREQDFVEYFTGTICSVPQFLPPEDYLLVSQSLLDDWERVKSLAMLAISANSYISQPQKAKGE
jgi:CRISPR-associated protein Cmx8